MPTLTRNDQLRADAQELWIDSGIGKQEILQVKIDPEVVDSEDVEMLEDLIIAAVNQALENAQKLQAEGMSRLTGGLQIPGLNV